MLRFLFIPRRRVVHSILLSAALILLAVSIEAQEKVVWSDQEKPIVEQLRGLRKLDDTVRVRTTKDLALQIRALPVVPNKLKLAGTLAELSTEGDFGKDTLQEVTTTLAAALREQPPAGKPGQPDFLYVELASLVRYEHMQATSDNPQFAEAMAKLEADDAKRQSADFTLSDLQGKAWHLQELRGKVVLVNFWATWCPPCRESVGELKALTKKYPADKVVLISISVDENDAAWRKFVTDKKMVWLQYRDADGKMQRAYGVHSFPTYMVIDGDGALRQRLSGLNPQETVVYRLKETLAAMPQLEGGAGK